MSQLSYLLVTMVEVTTVVVVVIHSSRDDVERDHRGPRNFELYE